MSKQIITTGVIEYKMLSHSLILLVSFHLFSSSLLFAEEMGGVPRNQQQLPGPMANLAPGATAPGMDPFHLLMNNIVVQKDLRLTETQLHQLSSISGNFRTQMRQYSFSSKDEIQKQTQSGKLMVNRVLEPQQVDRLRQIMLQVEGPCGIMADSQLLDRLNIKLASPQFMEIESLCQNVNAQIKTLVDASTESHANDSCEVMKVTWKQSHKIKETGLKQLTQSLSDTQRNTLSELRGRPIALSPMNYTDCNKIPGS